MNDCKVMIGYGVCAVTGLYGLYLAGKGLLIIGLSAGSLVVLENVLKS